MPSFANTVFRGLAVFAVPRENADHWHDFAGQPPIHSR